MATSSRPQRKRKQPDLFTPINWREERALRQALQTSLRPIPSNGSVSEDEVTSDDEVLDKEDERLILSMKKILETSTK